MFLRKLPWHDAATPWKRHIKFLNEMPTVISLNIAHLISSPTKAPYLKVSQFSHLKLQICANKWGILSFRVQLNTNTMYIVNVGCEIFVASSVKGTWCVHQFLLFLYDKIVGKMRWLTLVNKYANIYFLVYIVYQIITVYSRSVNQYWLRTVHFLISIRNWLAFLPFSEQIHISWKDWRRQQGCAKEYGSV